MGDGNFPTLGTTVDIGSTNKSGPCGSILQGDILLAEASTLRSAGDPGQASTPTNFTAVPAGAGSGWAGLANSEFRSALFYQVVDAGHAGETCSFTTSWASAAADGISWVLVDFRPSGGSAPGTPVDSENSQVYQDNAVGGVADAPTVTLGNSGDLFVSVYAEYTGLYQLTKPAGQTLIADTFAEGGAFFGFSTIVAYDTSNPSSGATGTRRATYSNSFTYFIAGSVGFNQPTGGAAAAHLPLYMNSIP